MSITDTFKQRRALRRIQRALKKDPGNLESLLELADLLGACKRSDRTEKRDVLHRILYLEPGNRQARAMLVDIDRAEIGGDVSRLSHAVILTRPGSNHLPEVPLVLRYSFGHQILVYLFMLCTIIASLSIARGPLVLVAVAAFLLIPLWFVSAVIEIGESGLRVSRLFGLAHSEIHWKDIDEVKPTILGHGVRIISRKRKVLEVSAHIHGYPFILDILRQVRPDLLTTADTPTTGDVPHTTGVTIPVHVKPFE